MYTCKISKHIFKNFARRIKVIGKIIHIDLVGHITLMRYDKLKYDLVLIDDVTYVIMGICFKRKK